MSEKRIIEALSKVMDPDLKKDIITLNMVRDLKVDHKLVQFRLVLTTPACPLKEKFRKDCEQAIHQHVSPDLKVEIEMDAEVTGSTKTNHLSGIKNIIAVVSGKGGVGKSTVATNLAISLANSGAKVALVDGDIYGPSIPILMGLQDKRPNITTVEGKDKMLPLQKYGVQLNSIGFLVPAAQAIVWRGPMASKALSQIIFDTQWEETDYLILDMPPGTGDLHLTLVQQLSVTGVIVVTTPQQVALADARKGAQMFRTPQINVPILGIVENMAYFSPEEMPDKKYYLFGNGGGEALATELNVPLLGQLPIVEHFAAQSDEGKPIATQPNTVLGEAFKNLAQSIAQKIAIRNAAAPSTRQVEITHR